MCNLKIESYYNKISELYVGNRQNCAKVCHIEYKGAGITVRTELLYEPEIKRHFRFIQKFCSYILILPAFATIFSKRI